ncbi:MAG: cobalamin biosynthesis protein CobD [Ilumatobacteraceae bacterium]|nr:cobalamin biosynthesis protein CobD [Ilumatobacteraceae bacterium]
MHPVARFGQAMGGLERLIYRDDRIAGVGFCAVGVIGAGVVGWGVQRALGRHRAVALTTFACVAGRMLGDEATRIGQLLVAGDIEGARRQLPALVGRSPDGLSAAEIARAVIESVAENSIDAVVAPAFWALVAGAPGVCAHRAINTLDAMVGHHSERYERFGWASARLDDAANWVPARIGAMLVAGVRPGRGRAVWRTVRRDAGQHPSPNGGVIESAYAAALGIRLGGTNRYGDIVEHRGVLGDGRLPEPADIAGAVGLLRTTTAAAGALGIALGVISRVGLRRHGRCG